MTIKEITALRKAGEFNEALKAAEEEFALNANNYTASTLFWCLYDFCKKEPEYDSLGSLYGRMKKLYVEYCSGDEYMLKSLQNIERRLDPLGIQIKEATDSAKVGHNNEEILNHVQNIFNKGELNENLYRSFGWLIYYSLKNTSLNDSFKRKSLLYSYLQLELPRPELLHSLILTEAVKVEKNTPLQFRIRDFMNLWGWNNLRPEDWEQYKSDNGHTVSSLVEKLISVYAKELKTDCVQSPKEFETLVDKALVRYPHNQYMPFYKAIVLKSKAENGKALDYYKQLILQSPSKCYLWHQAADLVENPELRIALLCKAIAVERDESFKGGCRLDLSKVLIEQGLMANAKYELDVYRNFYVSQGWNLKPEYREVASRITPTSTAEDNHPIYNIYIPKAEEFIYSAIPSILAIKIADKQLDDRNRPGKKIIQWTLHAKNGSLFLKKPGKFGLDCRANNGTVFDVKTQNGRIVWIKKSAQNPLQEDWIKKIEGNIRIRTDRKGNPYAILENAYIDKKLLKGIDDGQSVKVLAFQQEDGRWSAISLKKV